MGVSTIIIKAKAKFSRRHRYYDSSKNFSYISLGPEKILNSVAPAVRDHYLSLINGASGSLTGVIINTIESVFLPHFIVPAVFNLAFLGHYYFQIHIVRKWAKFNRLKLADRSRILGEILFGILKKIALNLLTLSHGDFGLMIVDAFTVHDGVLLSNQMVAFLNQAQASYANMPMVEGLNAVLGGPLNASQDAIGLGGQEITWTEGLSPAQITEMGFANEGNEVVTDILVEKPIDKAYEKVQKLSLISEHALVPPSPIPAVTPARSIAKRESIASLKQDVPRWTDIDSLSLVTLRRYATMYRGPRAEKVKKRLRILEPKPVGTVRWILGGAFTVLYSPVLVLVAAAGWISSYLPG